MFFDVLKPGRFEPTREVVHKRLWTVHHRERRTHEADELVRCDAVIGMRRVDVALDELNPTTRLDKVGKVGDYGLSVGSGSRKRKALVCNIEALFPFSRPGFGDVLDLKSDVVVTVYSWREEVLDEVGANKCRTCGRYWAMSRSQVPASRGEFVSPSRQERHNMFKCLPSAVAESITRNGGPLTLTGNIRSLLPGIASLIISC